MTKQPGAGTDAVKTPVYLDYQASTPVDGRVLDVMLPYLSEKFGNPHSRSHAFGWEAEEAVEVAREQIAEIIGADPKEVIFTSGATESNNLAIKGVAHFYKARKDHVITCVTEHKCVLESCRTLEREGFTVTYLPVRRNGLIDLGELSRAFTERTALVSIMAVNNEIGVIQPVAEIGALCREHGAFFHTDAAQAIGRIDVDVNEMGIDLMSLTAHKVYGPKGIGALYVRRRPRVRLTPLFDGGGQERGFRSGTLPAPLCVGFGEACRLARLEMADEAKRIGALRDRLYDGITTRLAGVALNGDAMTRIPGNLNLSFGHVDAEALMASLKAVAVSSGSACTSASLEPSFVLKALGVEDRLAHASIRFSLGRFTTEAEIDFVIEEVAREVAGLRESDPRGQAAE
ncbi:MAG: IscS subfamily cysteine desulfurase [Alphaproteobacteria bacterium]|nr:MAG: IscS subfamily cysteine desulfurase [Alphaproteobacteria bacterium]